MAVHSISNSKIAINVNSLGAELISLKKGNQEYLWQSDKNVWARYAPVLFPVVGKLKDNTFSYNGQSYSLPQHGFARDMEFTMVEKSGNAIEFELTANEDTLRSYPFHFSLRIRYELLETGLKVSYCVFNPANSELLFSIGAHPGFSCKRVDGESLSDYYLEFENKKELTIEKLKDGLLSGVTSIIKLDDGKLMLNKDLFGSDALVFKNTQIEEVSLRSKKSPSEVIIKCKNWPYFGIWTKTGSDAFVCLEPWYGIADPVNWSNDLLKKEGTLIIKPFKKFEASFEILLK